MSADRRPLYDFHASRGHRTDEGELTPKNESFSSLPSNSQSEHFEGMMNEFQEGNLGNEETHNFLEMGAKDCVVDLNSRRWLGLSHSEIQRSGRGLSVQEASEETSNLVFRESRKGE